MLVRRARDEGFVWEQIASSMNVSRQAVHKKHAAGHANKAWDKYKNDSQAFLYRVRRAYDGLSTAQVGARGQAVRVFFQSGGHVDVAPVFSYGNDVYGLPAGNGRWINTAPTVANSWLATRNNDLNYNLVPLVRMLKKWNAAHSKRLQSFHLETIAGTVFGSLGSRRQDGLARFFEWAPKHLDVTDPGGQSGSLSSYLTWSTRQDVLASMKAAADRAVKANAAEASGNHAEARRLWGIVLGPMFPK